VSRRSLQVALLALLVAGCGNHGAASSGDTHTITIAVDAPFSKQAALGEQIAHGVELVASQVNAGGGLRLASGTYKIRVKRYDDGLSAATGVANVRRAIADGAIAIVDEGTGVDSSWKAANAGGVPIDIDHQGGDDLVDPQTRPNVFRILPTDHGLALRYAEYLDRIHVRPAILHDDSSYGLSGDAALRDAFDYSKRSTTADIAVSADATDLSAPILRARRSNADGLLVWGGPATIASAISAARTAGWNVPVYGPPDAADPIVRQELSRHPDWVDGLTFADGRLTAEVGPAPFESYIATYDAAFGADRVGVKDASGRQVTEPPEYAMYASDFVNVLVAAIKRAGTAKPGHALLAALDQVSVRGANGDQRGFNVNSHESVIDDDIYFATFQDMQFRPVKNDPLSVSLPVIGQVG
jgi:ABC-type branched-subunit amino acid transport system substrate-binding protein